MALALGKHCNKKDIFCFPRSAPLVVQPTNPPGAQLDSTKLHAFEARALPIHPEDYSLSLPFFLFGAVRCGMVRHMSKERSLLPGAWRRSLAYPGTNHFALENLVFFFLLFCLFILLVFLFFLIPFCIFLLFLSCLPSVFPNNQSF